MGETRAETNAETCSNAGGAIGPGAAGRDEATASEGRLLRRWLAFSKRRERRLEQTGSDPDPRFTFANERTFLAWNRTALALIAAGLAAAQFLKFNLHARASSISGVNPTALLCARKSSITLAIALPLRRR